MATGPPFHRQLRRRYTARRRQNLTNINDNYNSGFLQTNHLETTNCDVGKCSSNFRSSSREWYFSAKYARSQKVSSWVQFIRNEAIQLVGRHHHWKCRTSSIWNKQVLDVVELCVFITHDTTVAQSTFQLESSTSTMLQHFASQSAQPLPRVCIAPRVATDRAALKTSNACSHCAAATQAVMTVPKDTRFNCRVAKRAVSSKEIRTMVWKNIGSATCMFDAHGNLYPCSMLQGTCNLRSPISDSKTKAFCLRAAWKMKGHLNATTIVTQHLISPYNHHSTWWTIDIRKCYHHVVTPVHTKVGHHMSRFSHWMKSPAAN